MKESKFDCIYEQYGKKHKILMTRNLITGKQFDEQIFREKRVEYRVLDPTRSKLGAVILKGISQIGFTQDDVVLYLGASYGYTPSFVSDIVGKEGFVFCVDSAPRSTRDLIFICEARPNMAPILADAFHPEQYIERVSAVDFIYQDIAQRNQAEIFIKNCNLFLKKGGFAILVVKSRSIDVMKRPKQVFQDIRTKLEQNITVVDFRILDPSNLTPRFSYRNLGQISTRNATNSILQE